MSPLSAGSIRHVVDDVPHAQPCRAMPLQELAKLAGIR
jgi:hypothetical protein